MASRNIKDSHPILQEQFLKAQAEFQKDHPNARVILTCTYRSPEEQNTLYAQGRTTKGPKVTNARGGQSAHNFNPSFAIDVAFIVEGVVNWQSQWFKIFSKYMANPKIEWGGTWKFLDLPHYEVKGWKQLTGK